LLFSFQGSRWCQSPLALATVTYSTTVSWWNQ